MIDDELDHDEKTEPGGGFPPLKCGTLTCNRGQECRFTWPEHEELHVCQACGDMAKRAANALGFSLEVLPLGAGA